MDGIGWAKQMYHFRDGAHGPSIPGHPHQRLLKVEGVGTQGDLRLQGVQGWGGGGTLLSSAFDMIRGEAKAIDRPDAAERRRLERLI